VATDDATLLDRLGADVVHVEGESTNLKITEPHDLAIAEVLLRGC
jgi:2-C-methyl-D-erythritol 4-phosphate cytidylyltransferase